MRYSNHVRAANGFYGWFGWLQTNSSKSPAFCKCGPTGNRLYPLPKGQGFYARYHNESMTIGESAIHQLGILNIVFLYTPKMTY